MMLKYGAVFVLTMSFASPVLAQSAGTGVPTTEQVFVPCQTVSETPEIADVEDGICVEAAETFVSEINNVPAEERDQLIADTVVVITELAIADEACNSFDDEISAAIRVLNTPTTDTEQQTRITDIATDIDECVSTETAAVRERVASPA